jgi:uncharacterized protein YndB with AHSA1/START domain
MRAHWVHVEHDFSKPPERVFAHLAEPENLGAVFGIDARRVIDGSDGERNGVGSRRQLRLGRMPPFEETVTEFVPSERIVYRITKGSLLRGHMATMTFIPKDGGTRFMYDIRVACPVPGVAPLVRAMLTRSIVSSLPAVERAA